MLARICELHCDSYLLVGDSRSLFYSDGIMILPEKWQKVIDQNSTYIID